ncbi:hypothetical protein N0V88_006953 [Collariella sp. IMI 366227]|nr:hypothetical protein N0V88_006953 [Collariella sp. IMI 366227]
MEPVQPEDQYFAYENRLASFRGHQHVTKGRVSSANSRAPKVLQWPHKILSPVALAKAGFFFQPDTKHPDNVTCFLCNKSLDGWDEDDNPLEEHLKHSPTCGWAIMAAIEAGYGNYGKAHPLDPFMIEARKATFAGRWPYESKRGFKCKTKKLVEGGWMYTPSLGGDDQTTCAYCHLSLEGWASDDNPFDEHSRREPSCQFFALINQYPAPKKGRAKAARASKASRLSVQSVATVTTAASDVASVADLTADHDDSVMTTASTMTQGGKKTTRAKKTTTAKGRKTKAKKDEPVEILADEPQTEEAPAKPAPRGRKRASDAMDDSAVDAIAPVPKKRATKAKKASTAADADTTMVDAAPAKTLASKKRGRSSTAKTTATARKASCTSVRSQASNVSFQDALPDEEELERQLEADLERYDSNAENNTLEQPVEKPPVAVKGRPKKAATSRKASAQRQKTQSASFAAFDPTPAVPSESEIDAEFDTLQAEMEVDVPAPDTLVVPKKVRKTGTRKVSKQAKKAKDAAPQPEPIEQAMEEAPLPEPIQAQDNDHTEYEEEPEKGMKVEPELADDPDMSTGTVITKSATRLSLEKPKRGRPSKKSTNSQAAPEEPKPRRSTRLSAQTEMQPENPITRDSPPAQKSIPRKAVPAPAATPTPAAATPTKHRHTTFIPPPSSTSRLPRAPATPRSHTTILPPRQSDSRHSHLPSHTPPSPNTENHHHQHQNLPSLQPPASLKRNVLAPVSNHQTPQRSSSR